MSNDKYSGSVTEQPHFRQQLGRTKKHDAIRDGSSTCSRPGDAAVVPFYAFDIEGPRRGKRVRGPLPTALCGRIPQQPIFVPAGKISPRLPAGS